MRKFYIVFTFLLFCLFCISIVKAQDLPSPSSPPTLVNDYSKILTADENAKLEKKLKDYNDSTSTQIVIIITNELLGFEPAEYSQRIGEKWGVGQKGKNNGIIILVKPTGNAGQKKAFIAPGYGLESVIPDAIAKRIVEKEMIPNFKENKFFKGLDDATKVLMALASKEYPASAYDKKKSGGKFPFWIPIVIIIFIFIIIRFAKGGSSSGHSYGGFSSGSGGFFSGGSSSSSSSFGGFGGGSFGGGGAGGSW